MAAMGVGHADRPYDPFISRGVMREKPRMIFLALAPDLSVAYDGQTSGLYSAWRGSVQNGNASYTHQGGGNRGATLYPTGNIVYHNGPGGSIPAAPRNAGNDGRAISFSPKNEALVQVWTASSGPLKADYRGYRVNNATQVATLLYSLAAGTAVIKVEETPDADNGALKRAFKLTGIPAGGSIALQLTGSGVDGITDNWTVAGGVGRIEDRGGRKHFVQDKDGETVVVGKW